MAIMIVLVIKIDIAIMTVLTIETNIHLFRIEPGTKYKKLVLR